MAAHINYREENGEGGVRSSSWRGLQKRKERGRVQRVSRCISAGAEEEHGIGLPDKRKEKGRWGIETGAKMAIFLLPLECKRLQKMKKEPR